MAAAEMASTVHAPSQTPWVIIAASAYRAHAASIGDDYRDYLRGLGVKSSDGMLAWGDLRQETRDAWEAAVRQAVSVSEGGSYGLSIEGRWKGWQSPGRVDRIEAEEVQL